jgi:hypothetical protein
MVGEGGTGMGEERAEVGAVLGGEGIPGNTGLFGWGYGEAGLVPVGEVLERGCLRSVGAGALVAE